MGNVLRPLDWKALCLLVSTNLRGIVYEGKRGVREYSLNDAVSSVRRRLKCLRFNPSLPHNYLLLSDRQQQDDLRRDGGLASTSHDL